MLELVLLGQPTVRVNGESVTIPTRKALALIAYLAIEGPAPRARLASSLWPSIEPEKARGNLRRELNRLRHTPLGTQIVSEGIRISLAEPFSSDVREFSKKTDARDFSSALELYRGPLLDGLELYDADGFDDWLARRRAALSERQRSMLALAARSLEESGDLRGALQCFLDLIRLDATQESFHKEAMRLHYLVGEREAAMERFAELKRVLRRELALEPLPETIELYRTIRAAKHVASTDPSQRKSISLTVPLIGRQAERKLLEGSERACVIVLADPGVGKTRLAEEVAKARSHLILRASEASSSTPLYPFATALRAAASDLQKQQRMSAIGEVWRREAARLVPEIDPDAPIDSMREEARARFLEGLTRALAAAVGEHGILVLDDLQWFDAASVELSMHLVRRALALGVRVIGTARPLELRTSPAATLVNALEKEALGEIVRLQPLGLDDVLALVRASSPSGDVVSFANRLYALTLGNPLFILETLKTLAASGDLDFGADSERSLPIPSGVRDAILAQVERLGPKVRRLLEAASLAGMRFSLTDLPGATGLGAFDAVDALEAAIDAGLLVRSEDGSRFHHDLVRRALADGLGAERRRLIHEKLALGLASREGAAARVAAHFMAASKSDEAIPFLIRAAEDALKIFAYKEALEHYEQLFRLPLSLGQAFEAHVRRSAIHRLHDDQAAWGAEVLAMEKLAHPTESASYRATAALARSELDNSAGRYDEALLQADRAIDLANVDDGIAVHAMLEGARALLNLGRVEPARQRLARAASHAPEHDAALLAEIQRALFGCALEENDLETARVHNDLARQADAARADPYGLVLARINDGTIRRRDGDLRGAIEHLSLAVAEAADAGFVSLERSALLSLASAHNLLGEYARAAELAAHGVELAKEPEDPLLEARFENALAAFEYSLGQLASSHRALGTSD